MSHVVPQRFAAPSGRAAVARAAWILASVAALGLAACSSGSSAPPPGATCTVTGVAVSASQATIASGAASTLTATLTASAGCAAGITWSASPDGGTLTPSGAGDTASFTATASAPKAFTITATSVADPTKSGSATVTVNPPATCSVAGVSVTASPASLPARAVTALSAVLDATGPCSGGLTWSVSPDTVGLQAGGASPTQATFTPAAEGTYVITATSDDDPLVKGSTTVTVTAPVTCVVTSVIVNASDATIPSAGTSTLSATVVSTGSCSGAVSWSSLGPGTATLSATGNTALFSSTTEGIYTITATSDDDPLVKGSTTVTVDPAVTCTVTGVTVSANLGTIAPGATSTLTAVLTASPGCNQALVWTITQGTGTVTPSGAGTTATFTSTTPGIHTVKAASVADPTKFATIAITVLPACTVTSVAVSTGTPTIPSGGAAALSAILTASPSCATGLVWSVTPEGGTLSSSGPNASFTSINEGTYAVKAASVADPTKFGTATVTVSPAATCTVTGVTVTASSPTIPSGGTATLTAALAASPGCNQALEWAVSPNTGGTLTPSAAGTSATFTSTTLIPFTITATSVADPSKAGSATVTVTAPVACGQANGTIVEHRGPITASETWAGDGVTHVVPASVEIYGSAVVTIEPCAIVTLRANVNVTTFDSARLVAAGTGGTRFVTFSASGTLLRWGFLRAFSPTSLIDLRWTKLNEGGEQDPLFGAMLAGLGAGYGAPPAPVLRVQHVEIAGSGGIGVFLDQNATFTADSVDLTVKNCASYPVRANLVSIGTLPSGLYVDNARKDGADEIVVYGSGEANADMTVKNLGVPYRVEVPAVNVRPLAPATAPVALTVEPGVVMKFPRIAGSPGALVTLGDAAAGTVGTLGAPGTDLDPIVFTSGEATPAPGDWKGLWLANAPGSSLNHVEVSHAGAPNAIGAASCRPAGSTNAAALIVGAGSTLYVPDANLITNSTVTNSAGHGISAIWQAATVNAPLLDATNTFPGNAGCSQTYNGLTAGTCPVGGGCAVP